MKNVLNLGDKVVANALRKRGLSEPIDITGTYRLEHFRNGELIGTYESENLITYEGRDHILNLIFHATGTQQTVWYVALVDNDNGAKNGGSPAAPSTSQIYDTFFDPAGGATTNTEYTDYTGGDTASDRIAYNEGASSNGVITNTNNKAAFTFVTNSGTLYGACLVNVEAKDDHGTGILMSYSAFTPSTIGVVPGDIVNVEIEFAFA
jgi:hypothetical protein